MKNITKTLIAASLAVIIASSMTACNGDNDENANGSDILRINAEYDIASVGINSDDLKTVAEQYEVSEPKLPDGATLVSIERISEDEEYPTFSLSVIQKINGKDQPYGLLITIFPKNLDVKDTDIITTYLGQSINCHWTQNRTTYSVDSSRFTENIAESIKAVNEGD